MDNNSITSGTQIEMTAAHLSFHLSLSSLELSGDMRIHLALGFGCLNSCTPVT